MGPALGSSKMSLGMSVDGGPLGENVLYSCPRGDPMLGTARREAEVADGGERLCDSLTAPSPQTLRAPGEPGGSALLSFKNFITKHEPSKETFGC